VIAITIDGIGTKKTMTEKNEILSIQRVRIVRFAVDVSGDADQSQGRDSSVFLTTPG
jgi:hypothetical protein